MLVNKATQKRVADRVGRGAALQGVSTAVLGPRAGRARCPSHWWAERRWARALGLVCILQHPALGAFPTVVHSDWQWWAWTAIVLDGLPPVPR